MKNYTKNWWAFPVGYIFYILFFLGIEYDPQKFLVLTYIALFFVVFYKLDKIINDEKEAIITSTIFWILMGAMGAYISNRFPFYHS